MKSSLWHRYNPVLVYPAEMGGWCVRLFGHYFHVTGALRWERF